MVNYAWLAINHSKILVSMHPLQGFREPVLLHDSKQQLISAWLQFHTSNNLYCFLILLISWTARNSPENLGIQESHGSDDLTSNSTQSVA